jgi:hypothetical protein
MVQTLHQNVANIGTKSHFSCESIIEQNLMNDVRDTDILTQISCNTQKKMRKIREKKLV